MASTLIRFRPGSEFPTLRDAMDRLFEDSFVWPRAWSRETTGTPWSLPLDVYETKDELVVTAVAPGAKAEDINIQFADGRLMIDVNLAKPAEENVTYHYREIASGTYHREITLPFAIETDKVEAVLQNGYLTLHLPKAEELKPKTIKIKTA